MKAIFVDAGPFDPSNFDEFHQLFEEWKIYPNTSQEELIERVQNFEVILVNKVKFSRETLKKLPKLRLICITATGMDNIDIVAARELEIIVKNVIDYSTESVANLAFAFILNLTSRLIENREALRRGEWEKSSDHCLLTYRPIDLHQKKIGIVGYGAIGKRVASLASSFGMEILISEGKTKGGSRWPLKTLLKEVDILTLHCPLTPETEFLIGKEELLQMKKNSILINVSRGKLIDEEALIKALIDDQIFGAGLDVIEQEPPKKDNPLLLFNHPRLLITPHIGWGSKGSFENLFHKVKKNVKEFLALSS